MQEQVHQIPLSRGKVAIIDAIDLELISKFKWHIAIRGARVYAMTWLCTTTVKRKVYMHRLIMGEPPNADIDHRDRDGLNNRRQNLRSATRSQNMANAPKLRRLNGTSSKFRGVSWLPHKQKWLAQIVVAKKQMYVGMFHSEEEAARAWDAESLKHWGEFAVLNLP